eukprot:gene17043-biopygen4658
MKASSFSALKVANARAHARTDACADACADARTHLPLLMLIFAWLYQLTAGTVLPGRQAGGRPARGAPSTTGTRAGRTCRSSSPAPGLTQQRHGIARLLRGDPRAAVPEAPPSGPPAGRPCRARGVRPGLLYLRVRGGARGNGLTHRGRGCATKKKGGGWPRPAEGAPPVGGGVRGAGHNHLECCSEALAADREGGRAGARVLARLLPQVALHVLSPAAEEDADLLPGVRFVHLADKNFLKIPSAPCHSDVSALQICHGALDLRKFSPI